MGKFPVASVAAIIVVAVNTLVAPADARNGCWSWELYGGGVSYCQGICNWAMPANWAGYSYFWQDTKCDGQDSSLNLDQCRKNARGDRPLKMNSCKASAGNYSNTCVVTFCGPVAPTAQDARKPRTDFSTSQYRVPKPRVGPLGPGAGPTDPYRGRVPKPRVGPLNPGLLEANPGFSSQLPSATGTQSAPTLGSSSILIR